MSSPQNQLQEFLNALAHAYTPDPRLAPHLWAAKNRIMESKTSAEPGPWRNERTPYLDEIHECLSPDDPCQEVVIMKGAQIGGTEILNNAVGSSIEQYPAPMMVVMPTVELAERWSKQRLSSMIRSTPSLAALVSETKNTVLNKEYPGGTLLITGANSAVGLRSMPARFVFMDEIDGYPLDVDGEGCPVELAKARARTFANKKIFYCSTPTFEETSRILRAFKRSDQRYYHVPCPHCGFEQKLEFKNLKYVNKDPSTVKLECQSCSALIDEAYKTQMLRDGTWIAQNPESKIPGFHLSSLYSPVGWLSWQEIVATFLAAKGNQNLLRTFVNTILGETWKLQGTSPPWRSLYNRRESYQIGTVPDGVKILTAGVDVQGDRLEMEVVGWGKGLESWSVDHVVIDGKVHEQSTWDNLARMLQNTWINTDGNSAYHLAKVAIDTGFETQTVYSFLRRYTPDRVMGIKGSATTSALIGTRTLVDVGPDGQKLPFGTAIWNVGSGNGKSELYGWLTLEQNDDGSYPPGYCHFPSYPEEYFRQLTAEKQVVKIVSGRERYAWVKTRDRNEILDCRVYARVALASLGAERWNDETWESIGANVQKVESIAEQQAKRLAATQQQSFPSADSYWSRGRR